MVKTIMMFILGLACLITGGDWFVDGATGIAKKLRCPEILIGATIVSIGTTLPEVMVSSASAWMGHGDMAYGNAIGSIICNTALIAAIGLIYRPGKVDKEALYVPVRYFFIAAAVFAALVYKVHGISRRGAFVLLVLFMLYMIQALITARKEVRENAETVEYVEEITYVKHSLVRDGVRLVFGAFMIAIGARLLIDNGIIIARLMKMPESVIALTFIALGTSLPELITAITSIIKGHSQLSVGNIVGANLFNLVLVLGASAYISPFSIPASKFIFGYNASIYVDVPVMLLVMMIMSLPPYSKGRTHRWQGVILLIIYAVYIWFQFAYQVGVVRYF